MTEEIFRLFDRFVQFFQFGLEDFQVFASALFFFDMTNLFVYFL